MQGSEEKTVLGRGLQPPGSGETWGSRWVRFLITNLGRAPG